MRISRFIALLAAAAAGFTSTPNAQAIMGSGTYTTNVTSKHLWDATGTYQQDFEDVAFNYTLAMDAAGKMTGNGQIYVKQLGGHTVGQYLDITVAGVVQGMGSQVKVTMNFAMNDSAVVEGHNTLFVGKMTENLVLDQSTLFLNGTAAGTMTVTIPDQKFKKGFKLSEDVSDPLPSQLHGNWKLTLKPVANGSKYGGTAEVTLASGKTISLPITGTYVAKTDRSQLVIKNGPNQLNISAVFSAGGKWVIQSMSGKLFNQAVK